MSVISRKRSLLLPILLIGLLLTVFTGCGKSGGQSMKPGTYEGEAEGMNGPLKVSVKVSEDKIEDIEILSSEETGALTEEVFRQLREGIIGQQGLTCDAVSGASTTTEAYIQAVSDAVVKAGATLKNFKAVKLSLDDGVRIDRTDFDVIVVGAGGAGYSAAITAAENGADVLMLEKMAVTGGNTLISGSAIAAPGNDLQKKEGIEDSADQLYEDILKGGDNKNDPELVRVLADGALPAYEWLRDDLGVKFEDHLLFFGGHSVKRSPVPLGGSGEETIRKMRAKAASLGITVYTGTKATALVKDDAGKVSKVEAEHGGEQHVFTAKKGIVLATGGFGSNLEMRKKYDPSMDEKILSTDSVGTTGDGIQMAEMLGADLVDMQYIQTYPTCHPDTGRLLYVGDVRLMGRGILVNKEGNRFVEELERRDVISKATADQTGGCSYLFWDEDAMKDSKVGSIYKNEYNSLLKAGVLHKADSIEEVAEAAGVDPAQLQKTVDRFNGFAKAGVDEDFHYEKRKPPVAFTEGPYYIMRSKPAVHHTMGGIRINAEAQVLDKDGKPIQGLYAAGETTGHIHGTNRLGSVAIADIVVFGRIAGKGASE
ncbi:MAG: flavocytochrome c [Eubacteriales bacterium]|nr:flavocytochrome c [Eubacteriales bacterium]